jgi:hypothetical protein
MKTIVNIIIVIVLTILQVTNTTNAQAQDKKDLVDTTAKKKHSFSIGLDKAKKEKKEKRAISFHYGQMDLGMNFIDDRSDYGTYTNKFILNANTIADAKSRVAINQNKSLNFNLHLITAKVKLVEKKAFLTAGLALQYYNFRFKNANQYTNGYYAKIGESATPIIPSNIESQIVNDTITFSKNKLTQVNLMLPVGFLVKIKLDKKHKLVLGGGVYGAYNLKTYQKQVSPERGKDKIKLDNGFFNSTSYGFNAEAGIDNLFRFYYTQSAKSMYNSGLDQRPYAIGVKFFGL